MQSKSKNVGKYNLIIKEKNDNNTWTGLCEKHGVTYQGFRTYVRRQEEAKGHVDVSGNAHSHDNYITFSIPVSRLLEIRAKGGIDTSELIQKYLPEEEKKKLYEGIGKLMLSSSSSDGKKAPEPLQKLMSRLDT